MILFHGQYGHGKTDLLGDALRTEKEFGEVLFVNVKGEDGYMTVSNMGLGDSGVEMESYKEFDELTDYLIAHPLRAMAVDSLKPIVQKAVYGKVLGDGVVPSKSEHWTQIHFAMESLCTRLRRCAKYVLCACPSDKSVNAIDGQTYITPDLPGRQAVGSAGWFDMVGFIKAETTGPKTVNRTVLFAPSPTVVTRQRLPKQIIEPIKLPQGPGGWKAIKAEIEKSLS